MSKIIFRSFAGPEEGLLPNPKYIGYEILSLNKNLENFHPIIAARISGILPLSPKVLIKIYLVKIPKINISFS